MRFRRLRTLGRLLRALRGLFPLTAAGVLVVAASAWAYRAMGMGQQDVILQIVGAIGLVVAGWSLLAVLVGAAITGWNLRKPRPALSLEAEEGHGVNTGFSLPALGWLPFASVEWTWASPPVAIELRRERGRLSERITPLRRGVHERVARRLEIADTFGLASISFQREQPAKLRFVPSTGALKDVQVIQGMAGGDALGHPAGEPVGDRIDMRRYGEGDPIRFVLWKVYARTRELMVRTPELALSPTRQTIAYLVAGLGDEAAAGAARVAVEQGALGYDWKLGADGADKAATTAEEALEVILHSGRAPAGEGGRGLGRFLETAAGQVRRAVVFVPGRPGPWLDAVAAMQRPGVELEFVVCTDGVARPEGRISRVFLRRSGRQSALEPSPADALREVVARLSRASGSVKIVDRVAGAVYGPETLLRR